MLTHYEFKNPRMLQRSDHFCESISSREIICIDEPGERNSLVSQACIQIYLDLVVFYKGFQHMVKVSFCSCEPEAVTLARFCMWPCTPSKPSMAFHQNLLLWMEGLILEGCIGADAFCRALRFKVGSVVSRQVC